MDEQLFATTGIIPDVGKFDFNPSDYLESLIPFLKEVESNSSWSEIKLIKLFKKYPRQAGEQFSKDQLVRGYRALAGTNGLQPFDRKILKKIQMKPTRTISGVTPITVLTKPFPCPGKCIFCPNDIRMPKSYLSDEPGAQRAERNYFHPYLQTYNRLQALHNIGHEVNKAELIVLGGTWSFYDENYQIWFIKECFRALNEFGHKDDRKNIEADLQKKMSLLRSEKKYGMTIDPETNKKRLDPAKIDGENLNKSYNQVISALYVAPEKLAGFDKAQVATWAELEAQQTQNEDSNCRCVGLVVETRPDNISPEEVIRIRRLGCTKTQIGVQSLQDSVLKKNHRGHDVAATRRAFSLLRQAGFKIHAHWMANLYGSNPELDKKDFSQLVSDPDFCPDELKIYPCSLIDSAELMTYFKSGKWQPYTHDELMDVVSHTIHTAPFYSRLTRIIRDIPSTDIVVGNKKTNFRQMATDDLLNKKIKMHDIRSREIRNGKFKSEDVNLRKSVYQTSVSTEIFLEFVVDAKDVEFERTPPNKNDEYLVGFLRLSLPKVKNFIDELQNSAMIREVHVYGQVENVGHKSKLKSQHRGFGTRLINEAKKLASSAGFKKLAVISAVGTRNYYRKLGFQDGSLYQFIDLQEDTD